MVTQCLSLSFLIGKRSTIAKSTPVFRFLRACLPYFLLTNIFSKLRKRSDHFGFGSTGCDFSLKNKYKEIFSYCLTNKFLKETRYSYFCVTPSYPPKKSGTSRVWITFPQITQKILTKDIFHWLELITEILSFLLIFSVRKTTTQLFQDLSNSVTISTRKTKFVASFGPLKANDG